jgi:hypothetical protein
VGAVSVYVLTGFRVDKERSVYYRKCKSIEELKRAIVVAFERKGADFVSIRKVKKSCCGCSSGEDSSK